MICNKTLLSNLYFNQSLLVKELCNKKTCGVGETCRGGECKCGNAFGAPSCSGRIDGSFCDYEQSRCKCSRDVDSCSEGFLCIHGICQGIHYLDRHVYTGF